MLRSSSVHVANDGTDPMGVVLYIKYNGYWPRLVWSLMGSKHCVNCSACWLWCALWYGGLWCGSCGSFGVGVIFYPG